MRFGLALSGGALRGVAHIGVLKALNENRLFPSWISGTSAGSIIASLYACGYSPHDIRKVALHINKSIFDTDYIKIVFSVLKWGLTRRFDLDGIMKGDMLERLMKELTKGIMIRDVKIPLAITSVNINNGQNVVFVSKKAGLNDTKYKMFLDNVPLYEAVRASMAIPVVFKPKMICGMRLVDGGVTDNLPLTVLKMMGADASIGINLGYSGHMKKEVDNLMEIGNQSIDIMSYHITRLKSQDADLIINPHIYDVGMTELSRIPECIERGYLSTMKNMDLIKNTINSRSSTSLFYKNLV